MVQPATIQDMSPDAIPGDEPIFVIRAQDIVGAATVLHWADLAERNGAKADIVAQAREHAARMAAWPVKKVPDLA